MKIVKGGEEKGTEGRAERGWEGERGKRKINE